MNFTEFMKHKDSYEAVAYLIIEVFQQEDVIYPNANTSAYFDGFGDVEDGIITIGTTCYYCGEEDRDSIKVPVAMLDNFDVEFARAYAKNILAERAAEEERRKSVAEQKRVEEERAKLAELLKKHPDMAP